MGWCEKQKRPWLCVSTALQLLKHPCVVNTVFITVLGLHGKVLVVGGYRGGFCKKLLEASPVSDRANTSRLQTDPLLAKAEPTSNSGSASGITDLGRKKKKQTQTQNQTINQEQL